MTPRAPHSAVIPKSYAELRRGVEAALLAGQREIERAKVLTYWETGRLINEHILLNGDRADYGAKVFTRLAADLHVSKRILYQCAQFARTFPIVNGRSQLNWAHYRTLCQVGDEAQRKILLAAATKQGWNADELEDRVRQFNLAAGSEEPGPSGGASGGTRPAVKLLAAKRGTPGLYPVVERNKALALDLGFKVFLPSNSGAVNLRHFKPGDLVRATEAGELVRADDATRADLFTYRCRDVRVVDGDTLAVTVALPPYNEIDKKLRLRGLDAPELDTPAGKAAKRFVQQLIDDAASVVLCTTKPDKYDRYLADVFITTRAGDEIFSNNALLETGHADRMAAVPPPEPL